MDTKQRNHNKERKHLETHIKVWVSLRIKIKVDISSKHDFYFIIYSYTWIFGIYK